MKIVLLHGIFNTGRTMNWMKRALEKHGFECFTPSLSPFDGRKGIEYDAANLKLQIDNRFGEAEKISLIGFSMGGIIARYYLQELGGMQRVENFFSISTPHHGTYWAYLPYPSKGRKQLRPSSDFLINLAKNQNKLKDVNLYSYWTPIDFVIIPNNSSYWKIAENKKFLSLAHFSMIFNENLVKEIVSKLDLSQR